MKTRILFVDDEPAILAALSNLLWRDRARWDMVFALGANRALDEFHREPFDVVISDMRMPDMDGATLLTLIRRVRPTTGRIILTGYAGDADLARVRPTLHELLSKPCGVAQLRAAIERSLLIRHDAFESQEKG